MEIFASVPVLFAMSALIYFASCRIIDHQIRSAEQELGVQAAEAEATLAPGHDPQNAPDLSIPGGPAPR